MAQVLPAEVIDQILGVAYSDLAKATQQNQSQPPVTPAQQAAVTAGMAGLASGASTAASAFSAGLARALAMLATAPLRLVALARALGPLYSAAYVAGAQEAADAAGGHTPSWMSTFGGPPERGEHWSQEKAKDALLVAQGGLSVLLGDMGIWIKEMSATQVDRVGVAVRDAIENGRPLNEAREAIDAIVHDATRARLIAETEYARAQTMAARETYRANGVPMVQWLHQPDACPRCMDNADVSPISVNERWPSGHVPVHPHCRCAEAPYYPPRPR